MLAAHMLLAPGPLLLLDHDAHRLGLGARDDGSALIQPLVDKGRALQGEVAAAEHAGPV